MKVATECRQFYNSALNIAVDCRILNFGILLLEPMKSDFIVLRQICCLLIWLFVDVDNVRNIKRSNLSTQLIHRFTAHKKNIFRSWTTLTAYSERVREAEQQIQGKANIFVCVCVFNAMYTYTIISSLPYVYGCVYLCIILLLDFMKTLCSFIVTYTPFYSRNNNKCQTILAIQAIVVDCYLLIIFFFVFSLVNNWAVLFICVCLCFRLGWYCMCLARLWKC